MSSSVSGVELGVHTWNFDMFHVNSTRGLTG